MSDNRWLPYLGDQVSIRWRNRTAVGLTSRSDPALVVSESPMHVRVGEAVEATWHVGGAVRQAVAVVEDLTAEGFTVRLPPGPATAPSRRRHERVTVSLELALEHEQNGSLAEPPTHGRTLDVSPAGARALVDAAEPLVVGEVLQVHLALDGHVEVLSASVVWEREHGPGERLAGLRFLGEVQASRWAALTARTD